MDELRAQVKLGLIRHLRACRRCRAYREGPTRAPRLAGLALKLGCFDGWELWDLYRWVTT